eukprot:TRINITY_DN7667_c1_g1_i4.p1 TRINITY_DN7667_c1_g1~~TRINITY_DN7667_c1_g1_i4.p1  ORF type:complete len:732 (+),score=73.37 TRINITY_DN7667_c1_g1_i4:170-2365(+)
MQFRSWYKQKLKLCALAACFISILIHAQGDTNLQGECVCEDISPPGNYSCEDQKRFDKCGRKWMVDNDYCALTCGRCICSDYLTPTTEQQQQQLQISFLEQQSDSTIVSHYNFLFEPEQEIQDLNNTVRQPEQQSNDVIGRMGRTRKADEVPCNCTDVAPPSTWEFTCQQHKQAGNCNHQQLIAGGFCEISCDRCPCLLDTEYIRGQNALDLIASIPLASMLESQQSQSYADRIVPSTEALDFEIPIQEFLPQINDPSEDYSAKAFENLRNLIVNTSEEEQQPQDPIGLLSQLLDKVQSQELNGTDIIASLNRTTNDYYDAIDQYSQQDITPLQLQPMDTVSQSQDQVQSNYISTLGVAGIYSPPYSNRQLYAPPPPPARSLPPNPPIPLPPPLASPLSPTATQTSSTQSIRTPTLEVPDTTLDIQSLSLPQLAFDLGVANVPLLNLSVVDTSQVQVTNYNSQNSRQVVVGTSVNNAVFRPQIGQYNSQQQYIPDQQPGYVPKSGMTIRGEGDLRSPQCFISTLEEIGDLSLFNKVMNDVGIALAHLIIPSDETVTFVAPSNTAIMRLMYTYDIAFQQFLDAPPDLLMALVSYHALKGNLTVEAIEKLGALDTMLGQMIYVESGQGNDKQVYLSGHAFEEAQLIETDIQACGIMLHTIDTLLMPEGLDESFAAVFLMEPYVPNTVPGMQQGSRDSQFSECNNSTLQEVLQQYQNTSAALFSLQQSNQLTFF